MFRNVVLSLILCLVLIGCSKESVPEKGVMEKVTIVQTEKYVTFFQQKHGGRNHMIGDMQKAAEKWEKDHPEWAVKGFSTAAGNHGMSFFSFTLAIEKSEKKN